MDLEMLITELCVICGFFGAMTRFIHRLFGNAGRFLCGCICGSWNLSMKTWLRINQCIALILALVLALHLSIDIFEIGGLCDLRKVSYSAVRLPSSRTSTGALLHEGIDIYWHSNHQLELGSSPSGTSSNATSSGALNRRSPLTLGAENSANIPSVESPTVTAIVVTTITVPALPSNLPTTSAFSQEPPTVTVVVTTTMTVIGATFDSTAITAGPSSTTSNTLPATVVPETGATKGFLILHNLCPFPVYHWTVQAATGFGLKSDTLYWGIVPPQGWYKEPWYPDSGHLGGVAVKLAECDHPDWCPLTQFEYHFMSRDSELFYDISNVNCELPSGPESGDCPFLNGGLYLSSDDPSCPTRMCASNDQPCQQSFVHSEDNLEIQACAFGGANFYLQMCADHPMLPPDVASIQGPTRGPNSLE